MRKHTTLIITLLLSIVQAWAVPARRGPRTMSQPDGTHITVYLHGDEHLPQGVCEDLFGHHL